MTEEPTPTASDIEAPNPTSPSSEPSPAVNAAATNANRPKKWKVISLGVVVLAIVAVAIALGVTLGGNNDAPTSVNSNNNAESTPASQASKARYLDNVGPIESKVRIIDPSVVNGYNSCGDLKDDILNALNYYVSSIIASEMQNPDGVDYEKCDPNDPNNWWNLPPVDAVPYASAAPESAGASDSVMMSSNDGMPMSKVKEDSFGTNNQVEGVDEADVVKSDGEYVFAAYGDLLYAWNATDGTTGVSITEMPYEKVDLSNCTYAPWEPMPIDDVAVVGEASNSTSSPTLDATSDASSNETLTKTDSGNIRRNHQRKASMMSSMMPGYWPCYQPKPSIVSLLLQGKRLTAIVSESSYWPMPMAKETTEPSIISDSSKLVVRVYDVENVPTDGSPLTLLGETEIKGSYNSARSVNDTAIIFATSYIDTYQLGSDLYRYNPQYCGLNASEYESLAVKTALNKTELFTERMLEELQVQVDGKCDSIFQVAAMQSGESTKDNFGGNLLGSFVQVISFDASSDFVDEKISPNVAGGFSSGWINAIYASQDFAATLSVGSNYNADTTNWDQATFILGFDISTLNPKPFCYAEISGAPLNQYSADLYEGHLRVVTTEFFWSDNTSRTTNKIFVLKVPQSDEGTTMTLTGKTDHVGKPNESIMSVRFMGDKGYIVTFERKDPFFVYDLSDPTNPTKLGELEIPGYSSYLHPIEINGVPLMLGIGMNVNETTGFETGVKISLFDVTDPTTLKVNATYVDEGAYSSAGYDFLSFRYLPLSQKLILPKSEYTYTANNNFDGFVVYDVALGKVEPSYQIQHASSYDMYYGCWYGAYMPARSFVFQSKLTTILSHSVISTDLDTGDRLWNTTLDGSNITDCGPYFYY